MGNKVKLNALMEQNFESFCNTLLLWYAENARKLPWRYVKDPYLIWLSEIILQQTRVAQGLDYYLRFVKAFPTINMLANAKLDDVLKLWQGLGYYSRARNLHSTAIHIVTNLSGQFPKNAFELLKLKGVGKYTSAAIASIAYGEKIPVVDGNVFRIISRFYGIFTPIDSNNAYSEFASLVEKIIGKNNPGDVNQSLMELGAIICLPKRPNCSICPVSNKCYALKFNKIEDLPIKAKSLNVRNRYFNYVIIKSGNSIIIKKRTDNDIWKGLFDFPLIETNYEIDIDGLLDNKDFAKQLDLKKSNFQNNSPLHIHQLTHQRIYAKFFKFEVESLNQKFDKNTFISSLKDLNKYPISRLIDKYLKNEFVIKK